MAFVGFAATVCKRERYGLLHLIVMFTYLTLTYWVERTMSWKEHEKKLKDSPLIPVQQKRREKSLSFVLELLVSSFTSNLCGFLWC